MATHLLVTNDYPPKTGGIQNYLHELWSRLEPGRGVVLTASSHADAGAFDQATTVVIERTPLRTLYWPGPRVRRAVRAAIARHDPALVLFDPAWPLGRMGRRLGVPYGVVLHGAEVAIPARIPLVRRSLRRVLRGAAVAVCAGTYPAAVARALTGSSGPPTLLVPPGVDTTRFVPLDAPARAAARREFGLPPDGPVVASFSRLVPRKGMDTLIRASAALAWRGHPPLVVIGGSGRDRRRLERLAGSLSAPVRFWGRVGDDALPRWLGASDVMVLACRNRWAGFEQEGFGIVFVEAASCGVATIAGRSGGSHEAVVDGETGVVLDDPRSAEELAAALLVMLSDEPRRARYGAAARARAVTQFDWRVLAAQLSTGLAPFDRWTG